MQGCCCHFPRSSLCNPIQFIQALAVTICKCEGQALAFLGVLYNPHLIHQGYPTVTSPLVPLLISSCSPFISYFPFLPLRFTSNLIHPSSSISHIPNPTTQYLGAMIPVSQPYNSLIAAGLQWKLHKSLQVHTYIICMCK